MIGGLVRGGVPFAPASRQRLYTGFAVGGFSGTAKILSAANQLQAFAPGSTLWLAFKSTTTNTTTEAVLGCAFGHPAGAGLGWALARGGNDQGASAGKFALFAGASFALFSPIPPLNGITLIAFVWRASDNQVLVSADGGALTVAGGVSPPLALNATCKSFLGTDNGGSIGLPLSSGRILGYAIWSREATATEAQTGTFTRSNRFLFSAAVRGDAACTVDFNAGRDWNGSAATITTLGSAPITYAVSGSPTRLAVDEIRYVARSSMYFDSRRIEPASDGTHVRREPFARLRARTDALHLSVEMYSDFFTGFPNQAAIGFLTNGAWTNEKLATRNGGNEYGTAQIGAGTGKSVDIYEGPQNLFVGVYDGTFALAARVPVWLDDGVTSANSSMVTPAPVQHRLLIVHDSIGEGLLATVITQHSQITLLRADYPTSGTGGVTASGAGSTSMFLLAGSGAPALAAAVALAVAELDGTVSNTLWIQLSTNDYGLSLATAAAFEIYYAAYVDAVHAASPGTTIYCQTAMQRIAPATEAANGVGSTLGAYRTAISNVVATRGAFCVLVDGTAMVSNANINADGIHLTAAGCAEWKASAKTTLAY